MRNNYHITNIQDSITRSYHGVCNWQGRDFSSTAGATGSTEARVSCIEQFLRPGQKIHMMLNIQGLKNK